MSLKMKNLTLLEAVKIPYKRRDSLEKSKANLTVVPLKGKKKWLPKSASETFQDRNRLFSSDLEECGEGEFHLPRLASTSCKKLKSCKTRKKTPPSRRDSKVRLQLGTSAIATASRQNIEPGYNPHPVLSLKNSNTSQVSGSLIPLSRLSTDSKSSKVSLELPSRLFHF